MSGRTETRSQTMTGKAEEEGCKGGEANTPDANNANITAHGSLSTPQPSLPQGVEVKKKQRTLRT